MTSTSRLVWIGAALLFAALWMARSLAPAVDASVVQDDARQHVFWMQRLVDPSLLQNDLFADYFASQAPSGFVLLYRGLLLFVDPLTASKLIPPVAGLVAALFTFLLVERLYPSRVAAFLATVLGSWYVWQYDDLPTGSPRGFLLPLTVVLLYALVAGSRWWIVAGIVGIEALLYPSAAALGVGLVGTRVLWFECWPPCIPTDWRAWRTAIACGAVASLLLAPTVFGGSAFGPAVDGTAARDMAEFGPDGRNAFFTPDPYAYWIASYRSGFDLRVVDALIPGLPVLCELLGLAALLPLAVLVRWWRPFGPRLAPTVVLIVQVLGASLGLFLLAHALLFRLYLPARFVSWTIPLVLSIAAGVGVAALLDGLLLWRPTGGSRLVVVAASLLLAGGLAVYPAHFDGNFVGDRTPAITSYLRSLPTDILVLAAPIEADSVPAFSGRRVLVNREYALAYHLGFYREVEQRARVAIDTYYADSARQVIERGARYGVGVILVNRTAFDPSTAVDAWAGSFEPYTSRVLDRVQRGRRFALLDESRRCGALAEGDVTVILVACLQSRI